jgi:hypothetical protein
MPTTSRLARVVLESPLFLLTFAVIPSALVMSRLLHTALPFHISVNMLLVNVGCLCCCVALRFVHYLIRLPRPVRYGAVGRPATTAISCRCADDVRTDLRSSGYHFTEDGLYGEKHDFGYVGTLLLYGGLLLLSFTGVRDNLTQFSGTVVHGLGVPVALGNLNNYYPMIKGPLSSVSDLPLLGIEQQAFPNKANPKGASDIVLLSKNKKLLQKEELVAGGEPARYRGYEIYLAKMLVDALLQIKLNEGNGKIVFDDAIKLNPLLKNEGDYNYYGAFNSPDIGEGDLFYDASHNKFRISVTKGGKKLVDTVYEFQKYREKTEGQYTLKIAGMGRWSELHVVHKRNMKLIVIAGIIALLGLVARIVIRPQRVWLEEKPVGCRAWGSRIN